MSHSSPIRFPLARCEVVARMFGVLLVFLGVWLFPMSLYAAFGVSTSSSYYTVDTGAGLVFKVDRANGGIPSIAWNGTELNDTAKASGIASGLGAGGTTVSVTADSSIIKITVTTDATNGVVADMTHYYVVKNGVNHIYMGTYVTNEPGVGELRWITRLQSSLFDTYNPGNDLRNNSGAIESSDVFGFADGTTGSKYYGNQHAKELAIRGISGPGRGVFMDYGTRESASGGPFFRDIQNQTSEVYNYMNSGHNQTEPNRLGVLHGPYALCFTTGATPARPDMNFMSTLGLTGYVDGAGRGSLVVNTISGRDANFAYTLALSNASAQYWSDAADETGAVSLTNVKPGDYTLSLFKGELSVHTTTVTVTAGGTTAIPSIAITGDPARVVPFWRIGAWDGTPLDFRNGTNIPLMHPSDIRQGSWTPGTFVVGSSTANDFPACMWKDGYGTQVVTFNLTAGQVASSTVRIGITAANAGGRPNIAINNWSPSSLPSASSQPSSRSLTIGTYRGNNTLYSYTVPSSALVAGINTLSINVISGSSGTAFLSPGCSVDCVELYQGAAVSIDPPITPTGFAATTTGFDRSVNLVWNTAANATGYTLRRAVSASGPFTDVASGIPGTSYIDTDVELLAVYTYQLIATNTAGSSNTASATIDLSSNTRPPADITWTGASSSTWDAASSNWNHAGNAFYFISSDRVRFDDTTTVNAVTVSGTLEPETIVVAATQDYNFSGEGQLNGPATLAKSGSGTLTLNNVNSLAGNASVIGGTLALGAIGTTGGTLGDATVSLANGTTFRMASSSGRNFPNNNLVVTTGSSATLSSASLTNGYGGNISGSSDTTLTLSGGLSFGKSGVAQFGGFSGTVNVPPGSQLRFSSTSGANGNGGGNAAFVIDGSLNSRNSALTGGIVLGSLAGSGSLAGQTNTPAGSTNFIVGSRNTDSTFAGSISNSTNGTVHLTKTGSATLDLSGASSYTGATTVSNGSLIITGSLGTSAVSVASGAAIGGTGSLGGNLTLGSGATLLFGVTPSATHGVSVAGTTTLSGPITVSPRLLGGTLAPGTYTVLTYAGSLAGSPAFNWSDPTGSGLIASFSTATASEVRVTLITQQQAWRQNHFETTANSGSAADDADPDFDGLTNLLEYALGSDPGIATVNPVEVTFDANLIQLTFNRIADTALVYRVDASSNLVDWASIWEGSGEAGEVTVSDTGNTNPSRFLRFAVEVR